jgi:integrase
MVAADLIEPFIASMRERGNTDKSIKSYRWTLSKADSVLPYGLDSANEEELRAWLWREGLAPATRATYFGALAGFFRWAHEQGHLDFDPTARIPRPKVPDGIPRVAKDWEVERVMTEAPQPYLLWGQLAAYGGLRCIEISRLHKEHIGAVLTALHRGKGNKPRLVPTHPVVWAAAYTLPPGPITEFDEEDISNRFKKWCQRSGMPGLSMHRLRGWHATVSYRKTKDIRAVQNNMGHKNPATTARYIDVADEQQAAAVNGLPTFGLDAAAPAATPAIQAP